MPTQKIAACGHENVRATHHSTLEVTTDDWLTPAGDCIVGVEASVAPSGFDRAVVRAAQSESATVRLTLATGDHRQSIVGRGDPALTFADDRSLVVRTSSYVDDRTVMVDADGAASDIDRDLVAALRGGARLDATFAVRARR